MHSILNLIKNFTEVVFPLLCPLCVKNEQVRGSQSCGFCKNCLNDFTSITSPICKKCGVPFSFETGTNHHCGDCLKNESKNNKNTFTAARSTYIHSGSLARAIRAFKYSGQMNISPALSTIFAVSAKDIFNEFNLTDCIVQPVPLHKRRLRERGFNQSLVLARSASKTLDLALDFSTLLRIKDTPPQVRLGSIEREKNVRGAFDVRDSRRIQGKKILLIDDVYTTGATVRECTKVLKKAGATEVFILTLARAAWTS
ncbi:MAG: ComF family protein [Deltaproteobacteria bacterium]|nr:ComF family protein [Deltaproteobacteria bacterium]